MQTIQSIKIENFKGIRAAEIDCGGLHMAVIGGKNGAGKSSFLDAVSEIFDPKGTTRTPRPIRDGEDAAEVVVTTDRAILTRTWRKNDAGTLKVAALDGATYSGPSKLVKEWTGAAPVDPIGFVGMSERDQRATLLARVDLGDFDLPAVEQAHAAAIERRKEVKRDRDREQAHADSLPAGTPGERVDTVEVAGHVEAAVAAIRAHGDLLAHLEAGREAVARLTSELAMIRDMVEQDEATELAWVAPDLAGLRATLEGAQAANDAVVAAESKAAAVARAAEAQATVDAAEAEVAARVAEKDRGLAAAVFPAGLGVDDAGITLGGVPFKQANSAAQITAALDLALPAHDAPDIRIAMVKDGSLLDDDTLAAVGALAAERGYFVIVERVGEDASATATFREGVLV